MLKYKMMKNPSFSLIYDSWQSSFIFWVHSAHMQIYIYQSNVYDDNDDYEESPSSSDQYHLVTFFLYS